MQAANAQNEPSSAAANDSTPALGQSLSFTPVPPPVGCLPHSLNTRSFDISQQSPRQSQVLGGDISPVLPSGRSCAGESDWSLGSSRDESAFYQAEAQMSIRENQNLRFRIRELGECPVQVG